MLLHWCNYVIRRSFCCMPTTSAASKSGTDATAIAFDVILAHAKERGITLNELAKIADVDRTMLWRYRNGMDAPLKVATNLADALGLSMDVVTGRGNPTPPPPSGPSTPTPPSGPKADQ